MKKLIIPIAAVVILLINSCNYEPVGMYEKYIVQDTVVPTVQLEKYLDRDTLVFSDESSLEFTFQNNQKVIQSAVLKSEKYSTGGTIDNMKVTFKFNGNSFRNGNTLDLKINFYSGTGSLADMMQQEIIKYSKKWTIIVLPAWDNIAQISKLAVEDGTLKIYFKKFVVANQFKSIYLRKIYGNDQFYFYGLKFISDSVATDSTYLGEELGINPVSSYIGGKTNYVGIGVSQKAAPVQFDVNTISQTTARLKLTNIPAYKNISSYEVWRYKNNSTPDSLLGEVNLSDSTLDLNYKIFGENVGYKLKPKPKYYFADYKKLYDKGTYSVVKQFTLGVQSGLITTDFAIRPTNKDLLISRNGAQIHLFKPSESKIIDSVDASTIYDFTASRNGDYIVGDNKSAIQVLRSPAGLPKTSFTYSELSPNIKDPNSYGVINNGVMVIGERPYFVFYDLPNGKILKEVKYDNVLIPLLSDDGKYMVNYYDKGYEIFTFNNGNPQLIDGQKDSPLRVWGIIGSHYLGLVSTNYFKLIDMDNNGAIVFESSNISVLTYDAMNPYLLLTNNNVLTLVNYLDGTTIATVTVENFMNLTLHNKILYSGSGLKYKF